MGDVGVHAGQRELDRERVVTGPTLEQGRPRGTDGRAVEVGGVGLEEPIGEVDVEPGQELPGLERAGVDRRVDQLGDLPVHPVEVRDPVVVRQVGVDGRHPFEDVVDGRRLRPLHRRHARW